MQLEITFSLRNEEIPDTSSNLTLQKAAAEGPGGGGEEGSQGFLQWLLGTPQLWLWSAHIDSSRCGSFAVVGPDKLRNVKPRRQNQTGSKCL